jgi:uncharacterized protein YndB with AHSA1/START domain
MGKFIGTLMRDVHVEVVSDASPQQVWAVVADVTRTGEWSHECGHVAYLDNATEAQPGVRFRGRNEHGRTKWSRTCEIVRVEAGRELAWRTVPSRLYPDSTEWCIRVEPVDGGTRIVQTFEVLKLNPVIDRLFWLLIPAHRDRRRALTDDMRNLGVVAAAGALPATRSGQPTST